MTSLTSHFILHGLSRRSFSRDLHLVDDICNYCIAHAVIVVDVETLNLYMTADEKMPLFNILNASSFF